MRRKTIIVCDSNKKYALHLQEYLEEKKLLPCNLVFFTDWEKFLDYTEKQTAPICVISEDWIKGKDERSLPSADKLFRLCEEKEDEGNDGIYRYRSAEYFAARLSDLAKLKENNVVVTTKKEKTKLIGVYSPIGRCLQTSFSLVLGQMLSSKYQVLYLNFEAYSGFSHMMQKSFSMDMADLIYYFKNLSQDFPQQFYSAKQNMNGMDFIPPAFSYMDITKVLPEEWEAFLDTVASCGEYDCIILDLSEYVQGLYRILRNCSHIYTITRNDGMAIAKITHYENVLKELAYEDVIEKTRKCSFPIYRQLPIAAEDLLYSELADYTRKIIREDFQL